MKRTDNEREPRAKLGGMSTEEFRALISRTIGSASSEIGGAARPHPLLVRNKRVTKTQKRRPRK
jgi:hypothetical protein